MLGDGSLEKRKTSKNASLKICRSYLDHEYNLWLSTQFEELLTDQYLSKYEFFDKRTNKTYYRSVLRTKCCEYFTEYYNLWYNNGKKFVPENFILDKECLQIWFADDGYVKAPNDNLNKTLFQLKISTNCFSINEVEYLNSQIHNLVGIKFHIYLDNNQPTMRLFKTDDCRTFLKFIDSDFPLLRKANIWRNPEYRLFDDITNGIICPYCKSDIKHKAGHNRNLQYYKCLNCGRNYTEKTTGTRKRFKNTDYAYTEKYWRNK